MQIYKILTAEQWAAFQQQGRFDGAPVDLSDGYIHTSTAQQAAETAAKHFTAQEGLMLAALDSDTYGDDLVWEPSRGGQLFPHIYNRPMLLGEIKWAEPLPVVNGAHQFPEMS